MSIYRTSSYVSVLASDYRCLRGPGAERSEGDVALTAAESAYLWYCTDIPLPSLHSGLLFLSLCLCLIRTTLSFSFSPTHLIDFVHTDLLTQLWIYASFCEIYRHQLYSDTSCLITIVEKLNSYYNVNNNDLHKKLQESFVWKSVFQKDLGIVWLHLSFLNLVVSEHHLKDEKTWKKLNFGFHAIKW